MSIFRRKAEISRAGESLGLRLWDWFLEVLELLAISTLASTLCMLFANFQWKKAHQLLSAASPGWLHAPMPIELIALSIEVGIIALAACIVMGAFSQFFYLTRFVFRMAGLAGTAIILGAPTVLLAGMTADKLIHGIPLFFAMLICIVPVCVMFESGFALAERNIPEFGRLIDMLFPSRGHEFIPETAEERAAKFYGAGRSKASGSSGSGTNRSSGQQQENGTGKGQSGGSCVPEITQHAVVLGLKGQMTYEEIRQKYLQLSMQYHPDKVQHLGPKLREAAEHEMKRINEAYTFFKNLHEARQPPKP